MGDIFLTNLGVKTVMNVDGAMFLDVTAPSAGMENTRSENNRRVVHIADTCFKMDMNNEGLMKMFVGLPSIETILNPHFLFPFYTFAMNGLNYMARDLGSKDRASRRAQEEIKILTNPSLSHIVMEIKADSIRVHLMEKPNEKDSKEVRGSVRVGRDDRSDRGSRRRLVSETAAMRPRRPRG